tara:strand:- start:2358 stop:3968 length:1611 start_codon:yes stop_codon:yes gene_type:complete
MAIGRITGQMLSSNLARSGTDLTFETNLLALDVSNSRVGIGTASPATTLHISATDSLRLPSGTTGQRPGSPANGDIRYNTTIGTIEGYAGGAYKNLASGSAIQDADEDTKIQVEESSDEDVIRFDVAGSEIATIGAGGLSFTSGGITSNLTVTGNLTVNGTTTTIDSTTLTIEDPLIQLAKNNSGGAANTFDQGIFFNRGSDANVVFIWDESADEFVAAVSASEDGTTAGNVTIDSYADLNANITGGATFSRAVVFNEASANDLDFRMESAANTHQFFLDGSADAIGINTSSPVYELDMSGSTDAFRLPVGNTAARPTAATGIIRFNSQTGQYEGCQDGSTYVNLAIAGDTPTISKVSGTGDGSTTTFTGFFSSAPAAVANVLVFIDNVYQEPTENYTVSGTNITFTSAPHSGARIFAITGFDNTALASGGVARTETSSVNFTSTATTIMSFNASTYRAAELFIVLQDSSNSEYSSMKATVVHNGTTAFITVYGITNSGSTDLATVTAVYDSGTVNIQATSTGGTTAATVQSSLAA